MSKGERIFVLTLVLILIAFAISGGWGCQGGRPTDPQIADVVMSGSDTVSQSTVQPVTVVEAEVKFSWTGGTLVVENPTEIKVDRELCYFKLGPHPQELLHTQHVIVGAGQTGEFPPPVMDYCGEMDLQVDLVGNRQCSLGSGNISPVTWTFVSLEGTECPCGEEWELVSETWSGVCQRLDIPGQNSCVEYGTATFLRCGTLEERRIRRSCECGGVECAPPSETAYILPVEAAGSPVDECAAYGPYVPVCKTENGAGDDCVDVEALFWICKQSTWMIATESPETPCPVIEPVGWSHVTGCGCQND